MGSVNTGRWTYKEDQHVREHYTGTNAKALADILNRSLNSVTARAHKLGVSKPGNKIWSEEEDSMLMKLLPHKTHGEIAKELGRSEDSVTARFYTLGLSKKTNIKRKWTEEEDQYLRQHYKTKSSKYICDHLNRSHQSVWARAFKLNVTFGPGTWTEKEDLALTKLYADNTNADIAKELGKTVNAVFERARYLGLDKATIIEHKEASKDAQVNNVTTQASIKPIRTSQLALFSEPKVEEASVVMKYMPITKMLLLGIWHGHKGGNKHQLKPKETLFNISSELPRSFALGEMEDYLIGKLAAMEGTPIIDQDSREVIWDPHHPDFFKHQYQKNG